VTGFHTQSTLASQLNNKITVSFAFNVNLRSTSSSEDTSEVRLSGIKNSLTPSTSTLAMSGAGASFFGSHGDWNATAGELLLLLAPGQQIQRRTIVEISFVLCNPSALQPGFAVSLSGTLGLGEELRVVTGEKTTIIGISALGGEIMKTTVRPMFSLKTIAEGTNVNGAVNTVFLTISPNIALKQGFKITLSGIDSSTESTEIPLLGPFASVLGGKALYEVASRTLTMTLSADITANTPAAVLFRLRNRMCGSGCEEVPILISASGGEAEPFLKIEASRFEMGEGIARRPLLQAGSSLSWTQKSVVESAGATASITRLTFFLQPSAPLFAGSRLTFQGLRGTEALGCMPCARAEETDSTYLPGLACSPVCSRPDNNTLAIFQDKDGVEAHRMFDGSVGAWDRHSGILLLRIAEGAVMSNDAATEMTIVLRNAPAPQARVDCITSAQEVQGECLSVQVSAELCSSTLHAWNVGKCTGEMSDVRLSSASATEYTAMDDGCATCVRHVDLFIINQGTKAQDERYR